MSNEPRPSARRDYRAGGAPIKNAPKVRAFKDTRRWCKGVVGRNHTYTRQSPVYGLFAHSKTVTVNVCDNCGRQNGNSVLFNGKPFDVYYREQYQ